MTMARGWCLGVVVVLVGLAALADPAGAVKMPPYEVRDKFEKDNNLKHGAAKKFVKAACGGSTLPSADGGELDVDLQLVEPTFGMKVNGKTVDPKTRGLLPLYKGTMKGTGENVVVLCDANGNVKQARVTSGGDLSYSLLPVDDADESGTLAVVVSDDIDEVSFEGLEMGDIASPPGSRRSVVQPSSNVSSDPTIRANALNFIADRAPGDKALQIAIAYDQTFCARFGSEAEATSQAIAIYQGASTGIYEPAFGLEISVAFVDANCASSDYDNMPNESGCSNSGYLDSVRSLWLNQFSTVNRDLMGFLTNRRFNDYPTIGCAYIGVICSSAGFGVNSIEYSSNFNSWVTLIAHETGHNVGATHSSTGFMRGSLSVTTDVDSQTLTEVGSQVAAKERCLAIDGECTDAFGVVGPCDCLTGYLPNNGYNCAEYNECEVNPNICGVAGSCTNTVGGYTCTCPSGYQLVSGNCVDINECEEGTDDCGLNATCTNTDGGFTCDCPPGTTFDGTDCVCASGYRLISNSCVDIDECAEATDNCNNATCINTPGGFTCDCPAGTFDGTDCVCPSGYRLVSDSCVDIDECSEGTDNCGATATCTNTPGGFTCDCPPGTTFDGTDCVCPSGYDLIAGICVDIDECDAGLDDCAIGAICTNTDGGFTCQCPDGTILIGNECVSNNVCEPNPCGPTDFECQADEGGGAVCVCGAGCTFFQRNNRDPTCNCNGNCLGRNASCTSNDQCCSYICRSRRGGTCR